MRSLVVIALAAAAGLTASQFFAYAAKPLDPPPPRFQLVGFTTDTLPGGGEGSGLLALSRTCGAEFIDARQCSAREVIESTASLPVLAGIAAFQGIAWVRAEPQPGSSGSSWSGHEYGPATTCGGWINGTSSGTGLVVSVDSTTSETNFSSLTGFLKERCNVGLPVACCALVP